MKQAGRQNSVFVGIRRGDYLKKANIRKYGMTDVGYYVKALDYIVNHVENPVFYVFSDDINWAKANIIFPEKVIFRDKECQVSDEEELFLMASCKHAIISNSTFNWWGAWMINNPNKIIIAPEKWFKDGEKIDIIPDDWIRM